MIRLIQTHQKYMAMLLGVILAGCSPIMRPPPAAPYMDSYGHDGAVRGGGLSMYFGDLDNGRRERDSGDDDYDYMLYSHEEWWGDVTLANYISSGYFSLGWGLQTFTPFMQGGFVSPYFGLTAWSDMRTLVNPIFDSDENLSLNHLSGGGMAIEQIPLNDEWMIGFTEHLSRNGREFYATEVNSGCEGFMTICGDIFPRPRPRFYTEAGGGFYVTRKFKSIKVSLELRYGRDWDENRNRFTATLDIWGITPSIGIGGNDGAKVKNKQFEENQNIVKSATSKELDSLHTIKRRWFSLADSTLSPSKIYHPTDSVHAVTSTGVCYAKQTEQVVLMQEYETAFYPVAIDSVDYCEETESSSRAFIASVPVSILGLTSFITEASVTGYWIIGALTGLGVGYGTWALFDYLFSPDDMAPKVHEGLCATPHTREQKIDWFKQYPCGEEVR